MISGRLVVGARIASIASPKEFPKQLSADRHPHYRHHLNLKLRLRQCEHRRRSKGANLDGGAQGMLEDRLPARLVGLLVSALIVIATVAPTAGAPGSDNDLRRVPISEPNPTSRPPAPTTTTTDAELIERGVKIIERLWAPLATDSSQQARPTSDAIRPAVTTLEDAQLSQQHQLEDHHFKPQSLRHDQVLVSEAAATETAGSRATPKQPASNQRAIFTNQFVIELEGGERAARELAAKHGFVYLNHILGDYYHLEHQRLAKRSISDTYDSVNISIQEDPQVIRLERQLLKRRVKRDFIRDDLAAQAQPIPAASRPLLRPPNQQPSRSQQPFASQQHAHNQPHSNQHPNQHQFLRPPNQRPLTRPANQQPAVSQVARLGAPAPNGSQLTSGGANHWQPSSGRQQQQQQTPPRQHHNHMEPRLELAASSVAPELVLGGQSSHQSHMHLYRNQSAKEAPFNDPSWPLMWYLDGGAKNGFDLNVMAAWKMGYTGKGIVITILDDGLEKDHPDLQANYDPLASFDINGDDADPMPRYDMNDSNRHGTRCAGEVAAVPDNNICSIGIAYNSKVGGVRMLDGDVTDAVEARSLSLNNQHIHIYSASWGPDDNGKTVDGPGELATRAFIQGVTHGRQGLGSIFVFASGNGGRERDNCNCDGYTNSIWTLSISSATENGEIPWYIENCSSTLATTYSSGSHNERQIATTDLHHSCTSGHTGTSASAPLAAGICALVLESNPRLTWRDMQHIVVRTAKPANLISKDWRTNGMGRNVSHAFGYGLMDAAAMIQLAKRWTSVPAQYTCEVTTPSMDRMIASKSYIELKLKADCTNVQILEHVQSKVTLTSSRRGDLHIYLISPRGTRSTLLAQRPNDQAEHGFRQWPFMTVHSWGESPNGVWTLEVHNDGKAQGRASLKEWSLILYGTHDDPNKHLESRNILYPQTQAAQPSHNVKPPIHQHPQASPQLQQQQQQQQQQHQHPTNQNSNQPALIQPMQVHHNNQQQGGNSASGHLHSQQPPPTLSSLPPPPLGPIVANKKINDHKTAPHGHESISANMEGSPINTAVTTTTASLSQSTSPSSSSPPSTPAGVQPQPQPEIPSNPLIPTTTMASLDVPTTFASPAVNNHLTTFKTLVSSPALETHQQTGSHQTTTTTSSASHSQASSNVNDLNSARGGTEGYSGNLDADFDIVTPPASSSIASVSGRPMSTLSSTTTSTLSSTTSGSGALPDVNSISAIPNTTPVTVTESRTEINSTVAIELPNTNLKDVGHNADLQTGQIDKPSLSVVDTVIGNARKNLELDGNQIDMKQSKDYRSSGDQSIYRGHNNPNQQPDDSRGQGGKLHTTNVVHSDKSFSASSSSSSFKSEWKILQTQVIGLIVSTIYLALANRSIVRQTAGL